ncbi:MAG: metallophosphoesterase [Streptosporangiales bacterium]|nr:metallophosphoesterase [Streptosporangiales bacterium]
MRSSIARTIPLAVLGVGAATVAYATVIERNAFRLRHLEMPVLAPGTHPLKVLHISDAHLTPNQLRKIAWLHDLAELKPDLVINTGDSISHPEALPAFRYAIDPLLDLPGAFVFGSNDRYAPKLKNPLRYLLPTDREQVEPVRQPTLPWRELGEAMTARGWLDLNNRRGTLHIGEHTLQLAGVDDSHIGLDRYDDVAGAVDDTATAHLGVLHSPEPAVLDRFATDGYQALFAGHTHGGQVCVPGYGALVSNCGLEPARAKGLSRHHSAWLHVSAGLGTSPYAPFRFACPPEASLVTLTPRH